MSAIFNEAYNQEISVGATELCFRNAANNTGISMVSEFLSSTPVITFFPEITQEIMNFYVVTIAGKSSLQYIIINPQRTCAREL